MARLPKATTAECCGRSLVLAQTTIEYYDVLSIDEDRLVHASSPDGIEDSGDDLRLFCVKCGTYYQVPGEVESA